MAVQETMENDRRYGIVNVTAKHREAAWKILRDPSGNLYNEAIVNEILATLLAKVYTESEL